MGRPGHVGSSCPRNTVGRRGFIVSVGAFVATLLFAVEPAGHIAGLAEPGRPIRRHLERSFKPLSGESVVMLVGDLPAPGNSAELRSLAQRIEFAAASGVDTVVVVVQMPFIEASYAALDGLVARAAQQGVGFIPRLIADCSACSERILVTQPFVETLPAFTNPTQLAMATALLKDVIRHLEASPAVVGYQVEWGHFGESWINAAVWDSPSSTSDFLAYLHGLSPQFASFGSGDVANWAWGQVMALAPCRPPGDPRRDPLRVAEFHAYQRWRNDWTRAVTRTFRTAAAEVATRPLLGFSYVVGSPGGAIGLTCTADDGLDGAYSDWVPVPGTSHDAFIRDAGFPGLHLGELDFDTPYFALERADEAVGGMIARGIIPVIFYPQWAQVLSASDIPVLVRSIRTHGPVRTPLPSDVLVVFGNQDIGVIGTTNVAVLPVAGASLTSQAPPGLLPALLDAGVSVDVVAPEFYTPELGGRYRAVLVVVPGDEEGGALQQALALTAVPVVVAHPSFLVGTPSLAAPTVTGSALCGQWNRATLAGQSIGVQAWGIEEPGAGDPPTITFAGSLAGLGSLVAYLPDRRLFSHYQGQFDEVLATADFPSVSVPTVARAGNVLLFGLATDIRDDWQRAAAQRVFLDLLRRLGVPCPGCPAAEGVREAREAGAVRK